MRWHKLKSDYFQLENVKLAENMTGHICDGAPSDGNVKMKIPRMLSHLQAVKTSFPFLHVP